MQHSVFGDPFGGKVYGVARHASGLSGPTLIGERIYVAVGARQVAPAVHLKEHLPDRGPCLHQMKLLNAEIAVAGSAALSASSLCSASVRAVSCERRTSSRE